MALFRLIWSFPRFLKSALILSASFSSTELFRDPPLLSTLRLTNLKIYYGAQQNLWEFNTQFYSDSWTHNHQQKEESVGTKPLRNLDFSRLLFQQWRSLGFTSYHNSSHNNEGVKSFGWVKLWKTYSKEWRIYRQNQSPFIWFIECKFLSMKEEARLKKNMMAAWIYVDGTFIEQECYFIACLELFSSTCKCVKKQADSWVT